MTRPAMSLPAATLFGALPGVPVRVALVSRMEMMGRHYGDSGIYE